MFRRDHRLDKTLTVIDWFCRVHDPLKKFADHLAEKFLGPECPHCHQRCNALDGHIDLNHAGD